MKNASILWSFIIDAFLLVSRVQSRYNFIPNRRSSAIKLCLKYVLLEIIVT